MCVLIEYLTEKEEKKLEDPGLEDKQVFVVVVSISMWKQELILM